MAQHCGRRLQGLPALPPMNDAALKSHQLYINRELSFLEFNRRVLAQFNLREAFAFCQLRSAANAHFSIRRVAQRIYEEMARVHPLLTKYMKLHDETWQGVEEGHFTGM